MQVRTEAVLTGDRALCFSAKIRKKCESKRKAMDRNWSNQKANPALKTKAGNN